MTLCPNCQEPVEAGKMICPHCGAFLTPVSDVVWPPAPGRRPPQARKGVEPLLTGRRRLDFFLGFLPPPLSLVLFLWGYARHTPWMIAMLLPFLATLILGVTLRQRYPVLARGIGWGMVAIPLLTILLLLGILVVCLNSIGRRGL